MTLAADGQPIAARQTEQRGWVKGRDDCWKRSDVRGCVAGEYRSRIAELKDR